MKAALLCIITMLFSFTVRADEPREIPLWPDGAPGALGTGPKDIPTITPYLPEEGKATGAAIVVCPGGGYQHLAPHEGKDYAEFLNQHGMTCFVLKYRLAPEYHHPAMIQDGVRAMRWVRANAEKYKIDLHRVGIIGSSAGGHLASSVATHFDLPEATQSRPDEIDKESARPDFVILCYPVISMDPAIAHKGSRASLIGAEPTEALQKLMSSELQVTGETPPCFIWAGADDKTVPVANSLRFAEALSAAKVSFELHIYQNARHGLGLGDKAPYARPHPWVGEMMRWVGQWNTTKD